MQPLELDHWLEGQCIHGASDSRKCRYVSEWVISSNDQDGLAGK